MDVTQILVWLIFSMVSFILLNKWPDFKNRCITECIVNCAGVTYKPMATPLRLFGTVITNAK